jgi:hypothetical protein
MGYAIYEIALKTQFNFLSESNIFMAFSSQTNELIF